MDRQLKRLTTTLVAFALLGGASLAWACTPQTSLFTLNPAAAPRQTLVEIKGRGVAFPVPVEIRWNSASGPKLGEAVSRGEQFDAYSTGTFSVPITIPDTAPGVYYILAFSGDNLLSRIAFEVTTQNQGSETALGQPLNSASSVSTELWSGLDKQGSQLSSGIQVTDADPSRAVDNEKLLAGMLLVGVGVAAASTCALHGLRRRRSSTRGG